MDYLKADVSHSDGLGVSDKGLLTTLKSRDERTARYREVLGETPHIFALIDEHGTILDACNGALEKLGHVPDDVIGHSMFEYLHPADHQQAALELMIEMEKPHGQTQSVMCRIGNRDHEWFDFEVYGSNRLDDPQIGGIVLALRDVSARRIGDRVLAAGDYLYSSLSTVASDATTIFDGEGRRVYVSASLGVMLGYSTEALLKIASEALVHHEDRPTWKSAMAKAMNELNGTSRTEVRLLHSSGVSIWIEATVVNLLKDSGVRGVVVHARNIDDRRKMEEALRVQANRDALTGLGNRFALMEQLSALAKGPEAHGYALLFCDLDGFKAINDSFGHADGDRLLVEVAKGVASVLSKMDFAARIGGDEFCILGQKLETPEIAMRFAEAVRAAVIGDGRTDRAVGVSIGVAWAKTNCQPEVLLNAADRAMYVAKNAGSNRIELTTIGEPDLPPTTRNQAKFAREGALD